MCCRVCCSVTVNAIERRGCCVAVCVEVYVAVYAAFCVAVCVAVAVQQVCGLTGIFRGSFAEMQGSFAEM